MLITFINNPDGSVEAHRAGCRDIARKTRSIHADSFEMDVASKREAFLAYNSDFLDEGTDERDCYPIDFLPCVKIPAGEGQS